MRWWFAGAVFFVTGCGGARTGLFVSDEAPAADDAGDAGDAGIVDAHVEDAHHEPIVDAETEDALPPIDAGPDGPVANPYCVDAGLTLVYVIGSDNTLYSFYPPAAAFTRIGVISCPAASNASPFSMAVDRSGTAYVVFSDGELFRVSTADASCQATAFQVGQSGFVTFGMGFAANTADPGETLYVASSGTTTSTTSDLASIDTTSLLLTPVGTIPASRPELTGNGEGRLFGFTSQGNATGSFVDEIDKSTGALIAESPLPTVDQGAGWAFAWWGSDFWLFTSPGTGTTVTRFRPSDGSVTVVAQIDSVIVGAGVSTCAPQ